MLAVVCPGQGAQSPGMLAAWLELPGVPETLAAWGREAGCDLVAHGTTSPADAVRDTAVAQPLIVAASLVSFDAVFADDDARATPGVVAGHSVGELAAVALAGVLTPAQAMGLVGVRGRAMAHAAAAEETGMSAVVGGRDVEAHLAELDLVAANVNGAGQVVAAGRLADLARLATDPPPRSRVVPLDVAGAFHSPWMAPARHELAEAVAGLRPRDAHLAWVSDRDGQVVTSGPQVLRRLVDQVVAPVRWDLCQERLAALGVTGLIELAPGGVLTGLARRALRGVETLAVKSPADLPAARELAARHAGPPHPDAPPAAPEDLSSHPDAPPVTPEDGASHHDFSSRPDDTAGGDR